MDLDITFAGIRDLYAEALAGGREAAETVMDLCEAVIRYARKLFWHSSVYDRLWFVHEAAQMLAVLGG
jgi:hypothetical protein